MCVSLPPWLNIAHGVVQSIMELAYICYLSLYNDSTVVGSGGIIINMNFPPSIIAQ